jgi:chromate transporter
LKALLIFWLCFRTSLVSFAGVYGALPEYSRLFVQERSWILPEQLMQDYVVAQAMPGPNMVLAVMLGYRAAGPVGAAAAFAGTYVPPLLLMSSAVALLARYRRVTWVRRAELAVRPVIVGLMLGAVVAILRDQAHRHGALTTGAVGVAAAVVHRSTRLNPLLLLAGAATLFVLLSAVLR